MDICRDFGRSVSLIAGRKSVAASFPGDHLKFIMARFLARSRGSAARPAPDRSKLRILSRTRTLEDRGKSGRRDREAARLLTLLLKRCELNFNVWVTRTLRAILHFVSERETDCSAVFFVSPLTSRSRRDVVGRLRWRRDIAAVIVCCSVSAGNVVPNMRADY